MEVLYRYDGELEAQRNELVKLKEVQLKSLELSLKDLQSMVEADRKDR